MESEISKESLIAFVDGELSPLEMERISGSLATRPELEAWVRHQEKLRHQLKDAFNDLTSAPMPERLVTAAQSAPLSWSWRARQWLKMLNSRALVPAGATLLAGLALGLYLRPASDLAFSGQDLIARGSLAAALDTRLSSTGYDGMGPRIGISFRDHAGQDCRTFNSSGQAGLACHQAKGWVVRALASEPQVPSGTYRMAGSDMPQAIRAAVASSIEGAAFDALAEKAARDHGWN